MREKFVVFTIALLLTGPTLSIFGTNAGAEPTRLDIDGGAYRIVPLEEFKTATEDQPYRSRYFSMMGDMTVNSFLSDADWLQWELSPALTINSTDLQAYWSFDKGDASDSSANSNDGTLHGPISSQGISSTGNAFSFDGNDYIEVPHSSSLNISKQITVEAWIYPTNSDSGEHMIISKGGNWNDVDPQSYELTMDRDRPLFQMKVYGSEDWYGAAPAEPITKNRWHHVAGVYDGNLFYIYIDGINQTNLYDGWGGDYMGSTYQGGLPTSEHNISIGRRAPASWGSLFFEGKIDEVRIYDRAVPPDEMKMHATIPGAGCLDIYGTPDNGGVGESDVIINITDGDNHYAERRLKIDVKNVPPSITSSNTLEVYQDEGYNTTYTTDETGGDITWTVTSDADFLEMDPVKGILHGTPDYSDVGVHEVNVTVHDGNGGIDSTIFDLEVIDINDAPWITTENILTATEDVYFEVDYEGEDLDGENLSWSMSTDAMWLSLNIDSGILNGTPTNDDVGTYDITITATDPRGLSNSTEFLIEVLNVNDAPIWALVPENQSIDEGSVFTFDLEAVDIDIGDKISYEISSYPQADIGFNTTTGLIEWNTTRLIFEEGPYNLTFLVKASDGEVTISHSFHVELILNPSPSTSLILPLNGSKTINSTTLTWEGMDDDVSSIGYDLYFGEDMSSVISKNPSTLYAEGLKNTSIGIKDLERGVMYYWTVIPHDDYSTGHCIEGVFSFHVNSPPTAAMISPESGAVVPYDDITLTSHGNDPDGDNITFYWHITTDITDLLFIEPSSMIKGTEVYIFKEMSPGETYYWTVIPEDDLETGEPDDWYEFTVNIPPTLDPLGQYTANVGKEIVIIINGTDLDGDDLDFELIDGPGRIVLDPEFQGTDAKCTLRWTPVESDVGMNYITIGLSDGLDTVNITIEIEVESVEPDKDGDQKDEGGTGVLIFVIPIIVVLIIIAVIVFFIVRKKNPEEPVEDEQLQPPETEEEIPDFTTNTPYEGEAFAENDVPPDPLSQTNDTPQVQDDNVVSNPPEGEGPAAEDIAQPEGIPLENGLNVDEGVSMDPPVVEDPGKENIP